MVSKKRILQRILGGTDALIDTFEYEWRKEKEDEIRILHNEIITILQEHKASWMEAISALEMVKWEYLEAQFSKTPKDD